MYADSNPMLHRLGTTRCALTDRRCSDSSTATARIVYSPRFVSDSDSPNPFRLMKLYVSNCSSGDAAKNVVI